MTLPFSLWTVKDAWAFQDEYVRASVDVVYQAWRVRLCESDKAARAAVDASHHADMVVDVARRATLAAQAAEKEAVIAGAALAAAAAAAILATQSISREMAANEDVAMHAASNLTDVVVAVVEARLAAESAAAKG